MGKKKTEWFIYKVYKTGEELYSWTFGESMFFDNEKSAKRFFETLKADEVTKWRLCENELDKSGNIIQSTIIKEKKL